MVKFSHVATLVELSNENKKNEKSKIINIWNKIYGTSYGFHKPGVDVHPITDETLSDAAVIDTLVCILLWN